MFAFSIRALQRQFFAEAGYSLQKTRPRLLSCVIGEIDQPSP